MSWRDHHSSSERLAATAEVAIREGDFERANSLYRQAAREETAAFHSLGNDLQRTRGVTAVSAVALWYKAHDYQTAQNLAHLCSAAGSIPDFAITQLRELLQMIWAAGDAEKVGLRFVAGDVLVAIKGGLVVYGGAPLNLILQKVEGIQAVLYRTVEMLLSVPFRRRGGPSSDVQSMFRPWLFQAPAGSYQFTVRMQEPLQQQLWEVGRPKVERVTETFFRVLRAASTNPEEDLPRVVPDDQYRKAFLSLSRGLAPSGDTFERLEVRSAAMPIEQAVSFELTARRGLNLALRQFQPPDKSTDEKEVVIKGVLRGLQLDRDWLEITTDESLRDSSETLRIWDATEVLDDVIGPLVNRKVIVTAIRRGSKYLYRDIDAQGDA